MSQLTQLGSTSHTVVSNLSHYKVDYIYIRSYLLYPIYIAKNISKIKGILE